MLQKTELFTWSYSLSQRVHSIPELKNILYTITLAFIYYWIEAEDINLIQEAACDGFCSDSRASPAVSTTSGQKRRFRQIHLSVIRAVSSLL